MKKYRLPSKLDIKLYGTILKRIYGPYTRKDGRKHLILWYAEGHISSISYPKYKLQRHLRRLIIEPDTVEHIDQNFKNDKLSNLTILTRAENTSTYHKIGPKRRRKK